MFKVIHKSMKIFSLKMFWLNHIHQARSQKILLGVLLEGNVDFLFQPTSPAAVKELIWCMHIAHIHEGL